MPKCGMGGPRLMMMKDVRNLEMIPVQEIKRMLK
jgi:hypothetical protein